MIVGSDLVEEAEAPLDIGMRGEEIGSAGQSNDPCYDRIGGSDDQMGVVGTSVSGNIDHDLDPGGCEEVHLHEADDEVGGPGVLRSLQGGQQQRCRQDVQVAGEGDESDAGA
jgi:hypothetical protein